MSPDSFGLTLWVGLKDADQRIFTPMLPGSPSWRRGHARRSALESVNSCVDDSIRGKDKTTTRVGLALAMVVAMTLGSGCAKVCERIPRRLSRHLHKPPDGLATPCHARFTVIRGPRLVGAGKAPETPQRKAKKTQISMHK